MLHPDSLKLIRHAYAQLTHRLLREGQLIDPAGSASLLVRHFDVAVAQHGQVPGDGRVEGRTIHVSAVLLDDWMARHKANRERRSNGWLRLTEAAQAFLIQAALTAIRGKVLAQEDLKAVQDWLARTPQGQRINREMEHLYRVELATAPAFYLKGEPQSVFVAQHHRAEPDDPALEALVFPCWQERGLLQAREFEAPQPGFPAQDITVAERARLISASLQPPALPSFAGEEKTTAVLVQGFRQALAPLLAIRPLPPAFLFENVAHGYRRALEDAAGRAPNKDVFDATGALNAHVRFGCVMNALDALQEAGVEDTPEYEAALLAGLSNLHRQD